MIKVKAKSTFHGPKWGNVAQGQTILVDDKDAQFLAANGLIEFETKKDDDSDKRQSNKAVKTDGSTNKRASKSSRAKGTTKD